LEGTYLEAINSEDFLYTRSDNTIFLVTEYGQPNLGMPAFGLAYGGPLTTQEMDAIVTFIRSWDDRIVIEEDVAVPALAEGEIPDYEIHVYPILKRRCISCHREGKEKGNYIMTTYDDVMTGGDNAPNVIGGDPSGSNLIRMINREEIEAGGPMPPTRPLRPEQIDVITRWVEAGALPVRMETGLEATEGVTGTLEAPDVEATVSITGTQ
jgi:mono/diheme cytochrome c family protein